MMNFLNIYFIFNIVYVSVGGYVCMSIGPHRNKKRVSDVLGAGGTSGYDKVEVDAGDWIQVFCKTGKYS